MEGTNLTMSSEDDKPVEKIKAVNPVIIVNTKATEKPCYSIMYYDLTDNNWHIGYSSFELSYVREWFAEYFDPIEVEVRPADEIAAIKEENVELKKLLKSAIDGFEQLSATVIKSNGAKVCKYAICFANPYDACFCCPLGNGKHSTCRWTGYDRAMELPKDKEES